MLGLIPMLACISDHHTFDPGIAFSHARQSFIGGNLLSAQAEADAAYRWSLASGSGWARRFQILEARDMLWRGASDELLHFLSVESQRLPLGMHEDIDSDIRATALKANALIHLSRVTEAESLLDAKDSFCAFNPPSACAEMLLARGQIALTRDDLVKAEQFFRGTIEIAKRTRDTFLESTALLGSGAAATQSERFDQAIALYQSAHGLAERIGAKYIAQTALSNQGWAYEQLGNSEKALEFYSAAEGISSSLGDTVGEIETLTQIANLYAATGQFAAAERSDLRAIALAKGLKKESAVADASMDLAQVYISLGLPDKAEKYAAEARATAVTSGSAVNRLNCDLIAGRAAMLRHDNRRAAELLQRVATSPDSQRSMKWDAFHTLGTLYESQQDPASAERSYTAALALVEGSRADLNQEVSQLTFLENASSIYDDYIHLLISEGKTQEALEAADWSRARTLQQGLGSIARLASPSETRVSSADHEFAGTPKLRATEIARKANSSLLFYWLGEKQSYLWVVSPEQTRLFNLPPRSAILPTMERYRRSILALKDPVRGQAGEAAADASFLYQTLVAPAAPQLRQNRPVVLFLDGEMGQLNFEALLVPAPTPHFWIEDATVLLAPSIRMFAETTKEKSSISKRGDRMLLFGDTVPSGTDFYPLPLAALEMENVEGYFPGSAKVYRGLKATPSAYLASQPEHFEYIHFVTHGTASRTDPLESAVILSQNSPGEDTYKLYARDILRHPIDARLVTISACNSSGSKSFAGEGMVGLSWAFLRAGAHNAIGSLWEVSDASTPEMMDKLYAGLHRQEKPAAALRAAKLSLIHSNGRFSRPFYWAPFQLYAGR